MALVMLTVSVKYAVRLLSSVTVRVTVFACFTYTYLQEGAVPPAFLGTRLLLGVPREYPRVPRSRAKNGLQMGPVFPLPAARASAR